jgi:xanthine dehydrogenase accessory factor
MSLRERREILALAGAKDGAIITLVRTSGSTYRRPGARLFTTPEGAFAGTISGGCLEAELLRKAAWKTKDGPVLEHYSTAFDDTAEIPYGLGCGGEVDLLLEPANTPEAAALLQAMTDSLQGETLRIATQYEPFARIVLDANHDVTFASEHLETEEIVALRAHLRTETLHRNLFLETLRPPQRLILFGAGEDAKPLVRLAHEMGWNVIVVDRRVQHARAERFPRAHSVTQEIEVQPEDCVVLMTHSYEEDRRLLTQMLSVHPKYLGLLGARHRSSLLLSEAAPASNLTLSEACARTNAPTGLDLGGDGPEAVALSILAEIQATLHARTPRPRILTAEAVLEQLEKHGTKIPLDVCVL